MLKKEETWEAHEKAWSKRGIVHAYGTEKSTEWLMLRLV